MFIGTRRYHEPSSLSTVRPSFKGELETRFFTAFRNGNKKESVQLLNNIKFDVFERDTVSGNNFLHIAFIENSQEFLSKALKLLKLNKDSIQQIISMKNKEEKTPLDYAKNQSFAEKIYALLPNSGENSSPALSSVQKTAAQPASIAAETAEKGQEEIPVAKAELVGNEIDEPIDLGDFSFGLPEETAPLTGLDAITGMSSLKQVFEDEIIKPLKNDKNVFVNGFLIHGFSGNGKTYAVEKLAEELGRKIIDSTKFLSVYDKSEEKGRALIETSVIKINPDELKEIDDVVEILKANFLKTNQQGFVFIDEIQKFFPADNTFTNNIRASQAIENSARKGVVLLATTRDLSTVDSKLINSLRFEKLIETRLPNTDEIRGLLEKNISYLTEDELNKLAKSFNGFSYNDIVRVLERVKFKELPEDYETYFSERSAYAKEHSIEGLTAEGTTSAYDTFLKRTVISPNSPQSLDDVIGMTEVKKKLRMVFEPIKKAGILDKYFKENSIKKPNGILLYGPPGCGKTFIMNAVAADTGLPMYQFKLSDSNIGSSYVNQTEKNIKKVFDQLRKKYKETSEASILFFDECDSVFSKNASESNQKMLNTLKEEMNNAGEDGIYIVAATNEKDNLNTAITRDGRFDTKIEVGYPDEEARKGLIAKALDCPALVSLLNEENINKFAKMTNGMSNATIAGIFSTFKFERGHNASLNAGNIEEFNAELSKHPVEAGDIESTIKAKKEELNKMKLKQRSESNLDWQSKTAVYDEFKERTYYSPEDPKSLNDVIGMERVKQEMMDKVLAPLNPILRNHFIEMNIPIAGGIIMHGPGGVGKTFIVKAVAAESKIPLYELKMSEVGTSYMNETARNIQNIFNQLKRKYKETMEPSILFLDECDSLLSTVNSRGDSVDNDRINVLNTLKTELADAPSNGIIVIAATNDYERLDKNVIRSGRFDDHIKVDYPDESAREAYLKHLLKNLKNGSEIVNNPERMKTLTDITNGMSNADMKTFVNNAIISAQRDYIKEVLKATREGTPEKAINITPGEATFDDIMAQAKIKLEEIKVQRGDIYED